MAALEEIEERKRQLKKLSKNNSGNNKPGAAEALYQRKLAQGSIAFDSYGKTMMVKRAVPENLP